MSWQALLATSILTYSFSIILQRILLKDEKSDPVAYSIIFQLLVGTLIGIYALFHGFKIPNLIPILPNLVLMTILYGAANILIFSSLKLIEASEFTIIFSSRSLWTIFGAILFLGEHFSIRQAIGTILILTSITLISWKTHKLKFNRGMLFSLVAAVVFGLAFVNDAFIIRNFDVPSYLFIAFIMPAFVIWVLNPGSTLRMRSLLRKNTMKKLGLFGILYAVSTVTIFLAYQVGRNAAQIAPLNQTSTVLTVLLAIIILKEKENLLKKLIGAVLSLIGVILVI